MTGPLGGLRVLDLTRLLPGGYATLLLADLGADVVKIEQPGQGDYIRWTPPMVGDLSAAHIALNRNKRSLTLNLKSPEGSELLQRLVEDFDVLVESFRPGVMNRLGVGYETLRVRNPALIYCAITGYGQDGPRSEAAGHDLNYIGYGGVLGITGEAGGKPVVPGVQIGDLGGGAMAAVVSILAALHRREIVGTGDFCDVAMLDGVVSWLSIHAAAHFATGEIPGPESMPLNGAHPCYRIYPAADGFLTVAALEPQFWSELCEAIERPDLIGDAFATGERGKKVMAELEAIFAARTRAEWLEHLAGRDVCVGPVLDFKETFEDEQVRHRQMTVASDIDGGESWPHLATPARLASGDRVAPRPPPGLGEHTEEVLTAAGITPDEIARLRAAGAI